MLEVRMAELAAIRANDDDRATLTRAFEAVASAYKTPDRRAQVSADVAFHRAIADATHNPVFSYLNASLTKLLHEHIQISISDLPHDSDASRHPYDSASGIVRCNPQAGSPAGAPSSYNPYRFRENPVERWVALARETMSKFY